MIVKPILLIYLIIHLANVQSEVIQLRSNNISHYLQDHVTYVRFYSNW